MKPAAGVFPGTQFEVLVVVPVRPLILAGTYDHSFTVRNCGVRQAKNRKVSSTRNLSVRWMVAEISAELLIAFAVAVPCEPQRRSCVRVTEP